MRTSKFFIPFPRRSDCHWKRALAAKAAWHFERAASRFGYTWSPGSNYYLTTLRAVGSAHPISGLITAFSVLQTYRHSRAFLPYCLEKERTRPPDGRRVCHSALVPRRESRLLPKDLSRDRPTCAAAALLKVDALRRTVVTTRDLNLGPDSIRPATMLPWHIARSCHTRIRTIVFFIV